MRYFIRAAVALLFVLPFLPELGELIAVLREAAL